MKLNNTLLPLAAALAVSPAAFGAWTKVADFQNVTADTIARYFQIEDASANIYIDAFDPFDATNKSLYMDAGLRGVRCNALFVAIPLPQEVPLGTKVTFKFDFFQAGPSYDLNAGLSPTNFVTDANNRIIDPATPAFNDFEAQIRMGSPLTVRDGSTFRQTTAVTPIGEWMTIYIVADGATKRVEGYLRTQSAGLQKVQVPVDATFNDYWNWRVGRDSTLKTFYMGSSNACDRGYDSADIYLIDNVYIDYTGVNLDGDTPAKWAGYTLVSGYADTGSFLGWVYPVGDYVYIVGLNSWAYLPEAQVGAGGAWMYMFK